MDITIRLETPKDYREVENLTREAFWNVYKPGCDEHYIVHNLRNVPAFIKELSFIAYDNNKIVGSIIYTKAKVVSDEGEENTILCMGPLSVLPSMQNKGIGSLLMEHSIKEAKKLRYKGIGIFGNPKYYCRFGYENAQKYKITTSNGENFDAFMMIELVDEGLNNIEGKFFVDKTFETNSKEVKKFDKQFPKKEKEVRDTQLKH